MNMDEVMELYEEAKKKGLVGVWPMALICVVDEYHKVSGRLLDMMMESENILGEE